MPVELGSNQITGISTAVSGSDAAYKNYVDTRPPGSGPSIYGNENEFLFTNGSATSWEPIQASQEYTTAGTYTYTLPTQAKRVVIESNGAGGGGASGNAMLSAYVPGSLWSLRTVGTITQLNALAFRNNSYLLGGTAAGPVYWTLRTSGFVSNAIQSLIFTEWEPAALQLNPGFEKQKVNIYSFVHPIVFALFMPKFKLLEEHIHYTEKK